MTISSPAATGYRQSAHAVPHRGWQTAGPARLAAENACARLAGCVRNLPGVLAGLSIGMVTWLGLVAQPIDRSATGGRIDQILSEVHAGAGIAPAALCSDDAFVRRIHLDLAGRIPTVEEVAAFRTLPDRAALIDRLLASPGFSSHFAATWTAWLIGYSNAYQVDRELFRRWLEQQIEQDQPFDSIATRLITASGSAAVEGPVNFLARHRNEPLIKVSRTFLGVRMDCARCHDHPFDRWTREDYGRMSLFFRGLEYRDANGIPSLGDRAIDPAAMNDGNRPRFLTGSEARTGRWRDELALYIVSCRPFARAFANRIWYQLMGRGVVEPPDDFSSANPPSVPELLDHLTDEAVAGGFQIRPLVRAICSSAAYHRSSVRPEGFGPEPFQRLFAVRMVKPLSTDQLIDSVSLATNTTLSMTHRRQMAYALAGGSPDDDFGETWQYSDTVQQLMRKLAIPVAAVEGPAESLYLRILSRDATPRELELVRGRTPSEIVNALIHGSEFCFSH